MSFVLLKRINDRAEKTYTGPELVKGASNVLEVYEQFWVPHWYTTAYEIRSEFEQEGLTNTIAEMDRLMFETSRYSRYLTTYETHYKNPKRTVWGEYRPTDEDLGIHRNEGP